MQPQDPSSPSDQPEADIPRPAAPADSQPTPTPQYYQPAPADPVTNPQPAGEQPASPPAQPLQPANPQTPKGTKQIINPLESMQPGERVICEVKRHPIGVIGLYAGLGIALLLVAIIGYGFAPQLFTDVAPQRVYGYTTLVMLVVLVLGGIFTYIGHVVYWGNRWIVTTDSVTQVTQLSLFDKQSSQLSMGNLEDITAEQNGLLPHLFNYGILKAETAGERSKFRLMYCPNPNYYAQAILQAREVFEQNNYRHQGNAAYPSPANSGPASY